MKVSELEGAELDYWVAKAEGLDPKYLLDGRKKDGVIYLASEGGHESSRRWDKVNFSTEWSEGGPIIEREKIDIAYDRQYQEWEAEALEGPNFAHRKGPTPLIAAMRAYVSSKYGDEV